MNAYPQYDPSLSFYGLNQTSPVGIDRLWNPPRARVEEQSHLQEPQDHYSQQQTPPEEPVNGGGSDSMLTWGAILGGLVLIELFLVRE